jgi:hypothetical protein
MYMYYVYLAANRQKIYHRLQRFLLTESGDQTRAYLVPELIRIEGEICLQT